MLARPAIGLFCTVVRILILCVLFQRALAEEPRLSEPLPPQPLVTALESLAEKMGLQMLYRMELAADVKSPGARAGGTAEETLQQLLRGTGL